MFLENSMKRGVMKSFVLFSIVLVLAMSFVSASFFGDLFSRFTGNVIGANDCYVVVNGETVETVQANDRNDCYQQISFGSQNCDSYMEYFDIGQNTLEQFFGPTDRVNNEICWSEGMAADVTCVDSDSNDYYTKGKAIGNNLPYNGQTFNSDGSVSDNNLDYHIRWDRCIFNPATYNVDVQEALCVNNVPSYTNGPCPNGDSCVDGACVDEENTSIVIPDINGSIVIPDINGSIVSQCANAPAGDFCEGGQDYLISIGEDENGCTIWGCEELIGGSVICSDFDSFGREIFIQDITIVDGGEYIDICVDLNEQGEIVNINDLEGNSLLEYYCEGDSAIKEIIVCELGCENGACVKLDQDEIVSSLMPRVEKEKFKYRYRNEFGEDLEFEYEKDFENGENGRLIFKDYKIKTKIDLEVESLDEGVSSKISAVLSNGRNAEIKVMPDIASEKALERLKLKNCAESRNCEIELKEINEGNTVKLAYELKTERESKVFGVINSKMDVSVEVDAENGEILDVQKPWWSFIASEPEEGTDASPGGGGGTSTSEGGCVGDLTSGKTCSPACTGTQTCKSWQRNEGGVKYDSCCVYNSQT